MCRTSWALHTRLLIIFARCVRHWAWHHHGALTRTREGRAGAAHWGAPSTCPEVPALSLSSGFPSGRLLRAPRVCLLCCRVGTQSSQAGKGSQQHPLPHPAAQHRHSTRHLHHSKRLKKGQSFLVIQPAFVTQPGPSSSISAASFKVADTEPVTVTISLPITQLFQHISVNSIPFSQVNITLALQVHSGMLRACKTVACLPGRTSSSSGTQDRRSGESSLCLYPSICPAEIIFGKHPACGFSQ